MLYLCGIFVFEAGWTWILFSSFICKVLSIGSSDIFEAVSFTRLLSICIDSLEFWDDEVVYPPHGAFS